MEQWMERPVWAEIDLRALKKNIEIVQSRIAPGAEMLAIVKGNCYGHGLTECVPVMADCGVRNFGAATLVEAREVRRLAGPDVRIVLLGLNHPAFAGLACELNVTTLIAGLDYARILSKEAVQRGQTIEVMGCIDTGMGRIGYQWDDPACVEELTEAARLPGLRMIGLFSHLACEDFEDKSYSDLQQERFEQVKQAMEARGLDLSLSSLANSPATSHRPQLHYGLVRPGGSLYGRYQGAHNRVEGIEAIMTVKAVILYLKDVPAGFSVSYGRSGITQRPSRIATLPVGYADGIPRNWGCGNGYVLIGGQKAPTIGHICMDQMMIDVTDVPGVKLYDEAVLIGKSGGEEIVLGDIGRACHILSNEVSLGILLRLPYKYMV
jgi:alanine racemase